MCVSSDSAALIYRHKASPHHHVHAIFGFVCLGIDWATQNMPSAVWVVHTNNLYRIWLLKHWNVILSGYKHCGINQPFTVKILALQHHWSLRLLFSTYRLCRIRKWLKCQCHRGHQIKWEFFSYPVSWNNIPSLLFSLSSDKGTEIQRRSLVFKKKLSHGRYALDLSDCGWKHVRFNLTF